MKDKLFIFWLAFCAILLINTNVQAQELSPELIPNNLPVDDSAASSSEIVAPSIEPNSAVLLPNIKYINEKDLKQSLTINEIKGRNICQLVGGCPNVEKNGEVEISIKSAIVSAISDNYLKVKIFDIYYDVDLSKAKILRYQWTAASLDDFAVGDIVNIYGFLNQHNLHLIEADTVRNISLQKNVSVFGGVISNLANNTFTLITENRGLVKTIVNDDAKIMRVEGVACIMIYPPIDCPRSTSTIISFDDLKDGERAIVRGEWNKEQSYLIADQIIVGNDSRPFFNKRLEVEKMKNQGDLEGEIKNQIKILQERIKELREQMKMQLFQNI